MADNKIIYSQNFKQWFGDWENNPQDASKVVDKNGYPLVVYHGSDSEFNEFKTKFIGTHGTSRGQGFYFTSDKDFSGQFGENIKAFYLNIRKPLNKTKLTLTRRQIQMLIDNIDKSQSLEDEDSPYGLLSNYGDTDLEGRNKVLKYATDLEYNSSDNDVELVGGIINSSGSYDMVIDTLFKMFGYDGIVDESDGIYVAHHANQIKEISNQTYNGDSNNMYENKKSSKKIFVTEEQYNKLTELLKEDSGYYVDPVKVKIVKKFLDAQFKRGSMDSMGSNGYPKRTNIFAMKGNNGDVVRNLSFNQMVDLLEDKFHHIFTERDKRDRFFKQILKDWYYKKITKEGLLSTYMF